MRALLDRAMSRAPLLIVICAALALATVFAMEHLGGLAPCPLCIIQRWPWGIALVLAAMGLAPGAAGAPRRLVLAGCALAFAVGSTVGVYHAGIEQGWFEGPASCSGAPIRAETLEALREQLLAAPVVRCDEVPWSLFGISLAGYNAIAAAVLAVFAGLAAARGDQRSGA